MIDRYSRKELTDIWKEENKYKIWLNIEIIAAQGMEKIGAIPKGTALKVKKKAKINVKKIHELEKRVKHDVIAFLTSITKQVGTSGKFLHHGMTSSDILDTSFNIQLIQSAQIILKDINEILSVLKILEFQNLYFLRLFSQESFLGIWAPILHSVLLI